MHIFITTLARVFAILGGVALSALIILTCLSVVGRALSSILHSDLVQALAPSVAQGLLGLGIGPIDGDFELVEAGMAFAIFAFLPLCQLHGAHASVDIFTARLPAGANELLRAVIEMIFAVVLIVMAVQLFAGMESKRASGQTTLLLQFPVWWGYALSLPGAMMAALVSMYIALCRIAQWGSGREIMPAHLGQSDE